jgi:hypothetical protein
MYYLATFKLSVAIMGNFLFMFALLVYKLVTKVVPSLCQSLPFSVLHKVLTFSRELISNSGRAAVSAFHFVQIFLGRLRDSEVERINERLHHGIFEICLTLTVFRRDFDAALVVLMGILAVAKVLHWLIQDRINYMQTEPVVTQLQHIRTVSFLAVLLVRFATQL